MNTRFLTALLTCSALAISMPALADDHGDHHMDKKVHDAKAGVVKTPMAGNANATNTNSANGTNGATLESVNDNAYVKVTGNIGEIRADEFDLNYGQKSVIVELDRFGWSGNETKYLVPGESVTVTGFVDDDLFEGREIEAYNIRLNDSFVFYYTNDDVNPSDAYVANTYNSRNAKDVANKSSTALRDGTYVTMSGVVSKIDGSEFTLTNGANSMIVDASLIGYDIFDDEGLQKIENGDRVYVYGDIDEGFFEEKEIIADGVVELIKGM